MFTDDLRIQAMRRAIGAGKLLTVAVSANANQLDTSYNVPEVSKVSDYISLTNYRIKWIG